MRPMRPGWIERRIAQGRGRGSGSDYVPWHLTREVPSSVHRPRGWKTDREHHLLSGHELMSFHVLEWSPMVVDIREQYPLNLETTQAVATDLGLEHPTVLVTNGERGPWVMTSDFLVTIRRDGITSELAIQVKEEQALSKGRVAELLEIERRYWEFRKTPWLLLCDRDIPLRLAGTVQAVHGLRAITSMAPLTALDIRRIAEPFTESVLGSPGAPLNALARDIDERLGYPGGSALKVAKHLIATRQWTIDMEAGFQPTEPLQLLGYQLSPIDDGRLSDEIDGGSVPEDAQR